MEFKQYIGLGDSISTDDYPGPGLGAISLLYKNNDNLYPEFTGKDLVTIYRGISLENLAQDGATTDVVLGFQLPHTLGLYVPTLVTLTIGGNDIIARSKKDHKTFERVERNLDEILDSLNKRYTDLTVILGTIYDPSDGLGRFVNPKVTEIYRINSIIHKKVDNKRVFLADIHRAFLGHGILSLFLPQRQWFCNTIEPNTKGGSEVRRVFLETLQKINQNHQ